MRTFSTGPQKLLNAALRYLPEERREWGAAMLAELAQLQQPFARWQFALGCARVGLFPPRKGGFFMNDQMKRRLTTAGAAALISLLLVAPFASLELWHNPGARNFSKFPFPLFGVLWLLPTLFIITLAPLVRAVRAGGSLLAAPVPLLLRVVFLALVALVWAYGIYATSSITIGAS
jgi:hypothetical protein